jgi:hypothetical protein
MLTQRQQNRILFWVLAIVPFLTVIYIVPRVFGSPWFFVFFLLYLFLYRPALVVRRLLSLNEIEEKDAWKFFIPLYTSETKYMRSLWLG